MKGKKRSFSAGGTLGTGYVSVIMIFVMITLTVLASLSFSAAGVNYGQSGRSREFTASFYEAENRANEKLMRIDEAAVEAQAQPFFSAFEQGAEDIGGLDVELSAEGYRVRWSEEISDRVKLSCEVEVFAEPKLHDNRRYSIIKWDTVSGGEADTHINVWDGTF